MIWVNFHHKLGLSSSKFSPDFPNPGIGLFPINSEKIKHFDSNLLFSLIIHAPVDWAKGPRA